MKRLRLLFLITLVAVLMASIAPAMASAEQKTFTIKGKVKDKKGHTLTNISVTISGGGIEQVTTTNSTGVYSFKNVPPGRYMIKASKVGYRFEHLIITLKEGLLPDVNADIIILQRPKEK